MTRPGSKSALAALSLAMALTCSVSAQANGYRAYPRYRGLDNCVRWHDTAELMRCFHCLEKVWTASGWQWANTCPPRQFEDY